MKVTYYKYWIEHNAERHRHSIRPFVGAFTSIRDQAFRGSFTDGDDNLFAYHINHDLFLFVITKDQELIKTISANTLSHEDIYRRLNVGEHIGFASYLHLDADYLGLACTIHGPKIKRWISFVNQMFQAVGLQDFQFLCSPFESQASTRDALGFDFKSTVRIAVQPGNTLFNTIAAWSGGGEDVQSIVVELKPANRSQMRSTFDRILRHSREQGIESLVVRAKAELEDQLTDFYVVGTGGLSRAINEKTEQNICAAIRHDIANNESLRIAVEEYRGDNAYETGPIQRIRHYSDANNWHPHLVRHRE